MLLEVLQGFILRLIVGFHVGRLAFVLLDGRVLGLVVVILHLDRLGFVLPGRLVIPHLLGGLVGGFVGGLFVLPEVLHGFIFRLDVSIGGVVLGAALLRRIFAATLKSVESVVACCLVVARIGRGGTVRACSALGSFVRVLLTECVCQLHVLFAALTAVPAGVFAALRSMVVPVPRGLLVGRRRLIGGFAVCLRRLGLLRRRGALM